MAHVEEEGRGWVLFCDNIIIIVVFGEIVDEIPNPSEVGFLGR